MDVVSEFVRKCTAICEIVERSTRETENRPLSHPLSQEWMLLIEITMYIAD